jgi:hypothetical protein
MIWVPLPCSTHTIIRWLSMALTLSLTGSLTRSPRGGFQIRRKLSLLISTASGPSTYLQPGTVPSCTTP